MTCSRFKRDALPTQEVAYVVAGRLSHRFERFCIERGLPFTVETSVRPPDPSTLFTSSGMQRLKPLFSDPGHRGSVANVQTCLRLNDLDAIGDGTHRLSFRMLGLFSFREMVLDEAIRFWLDFLDGIGLPPDHATIHPDRIHAWAPLYRGRLPIVPDPDCTWSDGTISGYCTELYRDGVEIGNIVNPLGDSIDCGFGLERLADLLDGGSPETPAAILADAISAMIGSGYEPGPKAQGYVLRKLLRLAHGMGEAVDHPFVEMESARRARARDRYVRLSPRHPGKPAAWWWGTHGVDLSEIGG